MLKEIFEPEGLTFFRNPYNEGPCETVNYCPLDSMFHINYRYSPFADDDHYRKIDFLIQDVLIWGASYPDALSKIQDHRDNPSPRTRLDIHDKVDAEINNKRGLLVQEASWLKKAGYTDELVLASYFNTDANLANLSEKLRKIPVLQTEWLDESVIRYRMANKMASPPKLTAKSIFSPSY